MSSVPADDITDSANVQRDSISANVGLLKYSPCDPPAARTMSASQLVMYVELLMTICLPGSAARSSLSKPTMSRWYDAKSWYSAGSESAIGCMSPEPCSSRNRPSASDE